MLIMAPARIDTNTNESEIKTVGIGNNNVNL